MVWIPGLGRSMKKEMATYSSILALEIPGTEEPGGIQSTVLERVGCNLETKQQQQQHSIQLVFNN